MKTLLKLLVLLIFLFFATNISVAGWNLFKKKPLEKLEAASTALQECECNAILLSDCEEEERLLEIAELECMTREEFQSPEGKKRIKSAIKLGKKKVIGDPQESIAEKVFDSLNSKIISIGQNYVDENFLIYSLKCKELNIPYLYRLTGYITVGEVFHLLFLKIDSERCFGIEDLDTDFPIITRDQFEQIKEGKYVKEPFLANIEVFSFQSYEKLMAKYNELKLQKK